MFLQSFAHISAKFTSANFTVNTKRVSKTTRFSQIKLCRI